MAKQQVRPRDLVEILKADLDAGYYVQVSKDGVNPDKKFSLLTGMLPEGSSSGQIVTWDGSTWVVSTLVAVPVGTVTGQILTWDESAWVASTPAKKAFTILLSESDTDVSVGDGKVGWCCPAAFDGWKIDDVLVGAGTKGVTGSTTVQARKRRAEVDSDLLSTPVTLTTTNYSNNGVVDATEETLATGDFVYADVDTIHTGTVAKGVSATITIKPF